MGRNVWNHFFLKYTQVVGVALPSFLCLLINMMSAFQYFCFYILFVWVGGCLKAISVLTYREPGLLTCDSVFH